MSLHTALKHLPQCYWYYYIQNILPLELSSFSMPILLKQYLKFMYLDLFFVCEVVFTSIFMKFNFYYDSF